MIGIKKLYILLVRSESVVSKIVRFFTWDKYTHTAINLNDNLYDFYSFARKQPDKVFPAGMCKEYLTEGLYRKHPKTPCALYELEVSDEAYEFIGNKINEMWCRESEYHYNILGMLLCRFSIPVRRPNHFFCSQFVGRLLDESGALKLPKNSELMRPVDYSKLSQLKQLYLGDIGGLLTRYHARLAEKTEKETKPELVAAAKLVV